MMFMNTVQEGSNHLTDSYMVHQEERQSWAQFTEFKTRKLLIINPKQTFNQSGQPTRLLRLKNMYSTVSSA